MLLLIGNRGLDLGLRGFEKQRELVENRSLNEIFRRSVVYEGHV